MGEKETAPFQFTFNGFLKVAFQGSRVTSDAGLILVRELDERVRLEFPILSLNPGLRHRCVALGVWPPGAALLHEYPVGVGSRVVGRLWP